MTGHLRRLAIAIAIVAAAIGGAAAQPKGSGPAGAKVTVALLPLDAEARLALYGQPVAAEVARALAAEGLDVAVVGQGDPVPSRAVLVVDGKLRKSGGAIVLELRVRDPARAEVLAEVSATAASLTAIDKAAAAVAIKLIPRVREQLAARARPPDVGTDRGNAGGVGTNNPKPPEPHRAAAPALPAILLVASSRVPLDGRPDAMVAAIAPAFERLIVAARHRPVASAALIGDTKEALATAVRAAGAVLGVAVDVIALEVEPGKVPVGRARARVRFVDAGGRVVFDRIVRTDTVVGKKGEVGAHIATFAGAQLAEVVRARLLRATGRRSASP